MLGSQCNPCCSDNKWYCYDWEVCGCTGGQVPGVIQFTAYLTWNVTQSVDGYFVTRDAFYDMYVNPFILYYGGPVPSGYTLRKATYDSGAVTSGSFASMSLGSKGSCNFARVRDASSCETLYNIGDTTVQNLNCPSVDRDMTVQLYCRKEGLKYRITRLSWPVYPSGQYAPYQIFTDVIDSSLLQSSASTLYLAALPPAVDSSQATWTPAPPFSTASAQCVRPIGVLAAPIVKWAVSSNESVSFQTIGSVSIQIGAA